MYAFHQLVTALILTMSTLGCGYGSGSLPGMIPVSGTVTFEGKPVEQGTVGFVPVEGSTARPATGTIKDGKFTMMTTASSPGAMQGKYRVMIISQEEATLQSGPAPSAEPAADGNQERDPKSVGQLPAMAKVKSFVPRKYSNPSDSGLEVEVTRQMQPLTFILKP